MQTVGGLLVLPVLVLWGCQHLRGLLLARESIQVGLFVELGEEQIVVERGKGGSAAAVELSAVN